MIESRMSRRNATHRWITLALFLLPTLFFTIVFVAYPVAYSGYLSLTRFNYATDAAPHFIGFQGYINTIFNDSFFQTAMVNQARFFVAYFVIDYLLSVVVAILVNELRRGVQFFQVIFYLPIIIPISLVGVTFQWIFDRNLGFLNLFLHVIGFVHAHTDWFGQPQTAIYAMVVAQAWRDAGFTIIIILAGLQGLPRSYREAARVDGASFVQEIWRIVLPNLKPFLSIGGIWILINSLKVYGLPAVITDGGPGISTLTLYYYSWKLGFQRFQMGEAAQVAYITALIILLLSWVLRRVFRTEK